MYTTPDGAAHRIAVIIPARNEEASISSVLAHIPRWVDHVITADNASTDNTAAVARAHGAEVVAQPKLGYGSACLTGMEALRQPDIVVFLDADFSDYPGEMERLVNPVAAGHADLVIGSRVMGRAAKGSLSWPQRFGNRLTCTLMHLFWDAPFTDLGPFRAIRYSTLLELELQDQTWGWTAEMQVKAAQRRMPVLEVPVSYRKRVGRSKISGTLQGVLRAGSRILYTIFREVLRPSYDLDHAVQSVKHMPRQAERLIVFTRYPIPGQTKTRLMGKLSAQEAADLHREMAVHTVREARLARMRPGASTGSEVRYTGGQAEDMEGWLGPDLRYEEQAGGDLGQRMASAAQAAFREGARRVLIVGTDCPGFDAEQMRTALALLRVNDLVLGPAADGGYYCIGMSRPLPELFGHISWGGPEVFAVTQERAEALGLKCAVLPVLQDVDRPEDLNAWESASKQHKAEDAAPAFSVIMPTLDEAACLPDSLAAALRPLGAECIVADGGSTDGTVRLAATYGAMVARSGRGRAVQMNAGASHASGEILVFVHADTVLPKGYPQWILKALESPNCTAGAFLLHVPARGFVFRLIEKGANLRTRRFRMPYGDQALFLRNDTFQSLGGFKALEIMEDFDLVQRAGRVGTVHHVPATIATSARRWRAWGPIRLSATHLCIAGGYLLGIPPAQLARWRGNGAETSRAARDPEKEMD